MDLPDGASQHGICRAAPLRDLPGEDDQGMSGSYRRCPDCKRERPASAGGRIRRHRRQDGKNPDGSAKMIPCEGSLKRVTR
jgi:hypothetical protein